MQSTTRINFDLSFCTKETADSQSSASCKADFNISGLVGPLKSNLHFFAECTPVYIIFNSYTMATKDLPDIYALARGPAPKL